MKGLICAVVIILLAGCAAVETGVNRINILDANDEYKLIKRNNDIYLERLDGTEAKRITHTPGITEFDAGFSADNKSILYTGFPYTFDDYSGDIYEVRYAVAVGKDDSTKKEIERKIIKSGGEDVKAIFEADDN